jgi:foldase protein PrsA
VKRFLVGLSLLLSVVLVLSACDTTSNYAAKVNGITISSKTILDELHIVTSNPRYVATLNDQLGGLGSGSGLQPAGKNTVNASYTGQLVFNRILVSLINSAAAKDHIKASPTQLADAEKSVRADLGDDALYDSLPSSYRDYLAGRQALLTAVMATRDTPQLEQAYYDQHKSDFTKYCVRHILVASQTSAEQLRQQIVNGGDFAAVAKQSSLDNQGDQSSASQGGALGCFSRSQLDHFVPEFRDGVLSLKGNEVSQPVKSQFGYHLIQVTSFTQQSFNDVKSTISQQLSSSSTFLTEQLASAKIKVNPRFGTYKPANEATGQSASIEPPTVYANEARTTTTTEDPSATLPLQ